MRRVHHRVRVLRHSDAAGGGGRPAFCSCPLPARWHHVCSRRQPRRRANDPHTTWLSLSLYRLCILLENTPKIHPKSTGMKMNRYVRIANLLAELVVDLRFIYTRWSSETIEVSELSRSETEQKGKRNPSKSLQNLAALNMFVMLKFGNGS